MGKVWERLASGEYHCSEHGKTFKPGFYCEGCANDSRAEEASEIAARSERLSHRRLLTLLEHESRFIRLSYRAEKISDAYVKERPDIAVRALGEAIKAGRAAAQLCSARDEWERMERLERAAAELARRRDNLASKLH